MGRLFKALWSVKTLNEHTVKGYTKHLRLLSNNVKLDETDSIEKYILGIAGKNKYNNNLLGANTVYCKTRAFFDRVVIS